MRDWWKRNYSYVIVGLAFIGVWEMAMRFLSLAFDTANIMLMNSGPKG